MIYTIILGLLAGYREVQILCDRGSWNYMSFRNWFWFTNQADKKVSNWDSFHVSNGVYALVLCIFLATCTTGLSWDYVGTKLNQILGTWSILAYVPILWVVYMYFRNLMLHVILPYKPDLRYLIPLLGTLIKKK